MKQFQKTIATCKYDHKTTNRKKERERKKGVSERSINVICFTTTRWRHNSSFIFFLQSQILLQYNRTRQLTKMPHSQAFFIDLYRPIYILSHFRWWPLTESWLLAVLSQYTHPIAFMHLSIYPSTHTYNIYNAYLLSLVGKQKGGVRSGHITNLSQG